MRNGLLRLVPISFAFLILAVSALAQQNRVTSKIDPNRMVALTGHIHPAATAENDLGAVEPSFKISGMTLYMRPSSTQQATLNQLLADQQNPASPNFRKWLTPEQYADQFGASQSDMDQTVAWLKSQGFTIGQVARGRTWILFGGTAKQIQGAFRTAIHRYSVNGVSHYANTTDPSIPAALSNIVSGIRGLTDLSRMKPRLVRSRLNPNQTTRGGHQIVPDDFATIYDIMPLYSAGIDGTGQSLAIVGQTDIDVSDITKFRSTYNLSTINLTQTRVPGTPDPGISPGDLDEADLDIEWSSAVARNANINYVFSDNVFTSVTYAIDQNIAPVISMSYGLCEVGGGLIFLPSTQMMAQQANAQGQTWLAATGDQGATDCDELDSSSGNVSVAQNGLSVDSPSSTPEVTAMGGTEFNEGGTSYWNTSNSPNLALALSYIPEKVWNDSAQQQSLDGGGGGASVYFPKPVWQAGNGVPSDGFRHIPDVSLSASNDHDPYVIYSGGSQVLVGGTSVAAPSMAGIVTLLNHSLKTNGLGNINPTLYRLAQGPNAANVFHDVTVGNNSQPCAIGSPDCATGTAGFNATVGYDSASGLGSVDVAQLANLWSSAAPSGSSVVPSLFQVVGGQPYPANPVYEQGSSWPFTLTLTEEAGVATTLTGLTINGQSYNVGSAFGTTAIPANQSISSTNLVLTGLSVPTNVTLQLTGKDSSGAPWSQQFSVPFQGPQTQLTVGGISNSATGQQTYAPGMLLSVYGAAMGDFAQSTFTIPLPEYLAGFEATINGVPCPLYYVSPNQVNLQIPYETQTGTATLTVGNPYLNVDFNFRVQATAPGIFQANGMVSPPFSSATRGQTTTLFITGEGRVTPSLADGETPPVSTPLSNLPKPRAAVTVTVAGETAAQAFIGIPNGLVGVTQINYTIPADAPLGLQPVVVTVGNIASPPVNINITQ